VVPSGTPNGLTVIISAFSLGTSSQFSQRQQDDDDDEDDTTSAAEPLFNNVEVDNNNKIAETDFMVMYSSVERERKFGRCILNVCQITVREQTFAVLFFWRSDDPWSCT
jgi:hypothetical protein